jgi:cytochrome P450
MTAALKTVPGERGLPILGHTLRFMQNCNQLYTEMHSKYGSVYYSRYLTTKAINLLSPEGNEFVLLDRDKNFSSRLAWNMPLKNLFPNGLMLRDGDDHRFHRRLMMAPFKSEALETYVQLMNPHVSDAVRTWGAEQNFMFYPAIKQLTLDLAAKIFLGENLHAEANEINQAFVDLVEASMVLVRYPLLGNKYQCGLAGRELLEKYFRQRIPLKKVSGDTDMFAEICRAEGDAGEQFSDQDIIDHMIFLMMAAHDTTTSSISSVCFALAKNPEWQDKIRSDAIKFQAESQNTKAISYQDMAKFETAELVLKEALRLYPPLPMIPRTAIKDCEFQGFEIKRGDHVHVSPYFTHRMPEIWSSPDQFDPMRFSKQRAEDRQHKHAWIPFGGGAHKCLGLKFAEIQIKLVLFHILTQYELEVDQDYEMPYRPAPIGKPQDNLPLRLRKL